MHQNLSCAAIIKAATGDFLSFSFFKMEGCKHMQTNYARRDPLKDNDRLYWQSFCACLLPSLSSLSPVTRRRESFGAGGGSRCRRRAWNLSAFVFWQLVQMKGIAPWLHWQDRGIIKASSSGCKINAWERWDVQAGRRRRRQMSYALGKKNKLFFSS